MAPAHRMPMLPRLVIGPFCLALLLPGACGDGAASSSTYITYSTRLERGQGTATCNGLSFTVADAGLTVAGRPSAAESTSHVETDGTEVKITLGLVVLEVDFADMTLRVDGKAYGTVATGDRIAVAAPTDGGRTVTVNDEPRAAR